MMAIINEVSHEASEMYIHPKYDAAAPFVRFSEVTIIALARQISRFQSLMKSSAPIIALAPLPGQKGEALTAVGFAITRTWSTA